MPAKPTPPSGSDSADDGGVHGDVADGGMALSWRARRRWSLVILLAGLPLYIVAAVSLVALIDRPGIWVEFAVYLGLGLLWALPFRLVFSGIGRPDPRAGTAPPPRDG